MPNDIRRWAASPVTNIPSDRDDRLPEQGIGLCLSGGGYRAMLFHLGTLWRLAEVGLLNRCARISSVSGGSATAAYLAVQWQRLGKSEMDAETFKQHVVPGIRNLANHTIDVNNVLRGLFTFGTISSKVAKAYDRHLFRGATLADLPDSPRFVINATSVQSGVLWRFSRPYIWDYKVGKIENPTVSLAAAVAASSAFPPFLSPAVLKLKREDFTPDTGTELQREPFITRAVLSDGGVYDNLGLETVWKRYDTVFVSDAGGTYQPQGKPARDWARHAYRVLDTIDNQVRGLRKQQVIGSYVLRNWLIDTQGLSEDSHTVRRLSRRGAYWGIRSLLSSYQLPNPPLSCPAERTLQLAAVPTRLRGMDNRLQERLINWGYAICDAALRKHFDPNLPMPAFPYPDGV